MKQEKMLVLSPAEMLEEWKIRKGFYPGLRGCFVERDDGVDTDSILTREMSGWYARLLSEAPAELLPVADVGERCEVTVDKRLTATISLPGDCVRVLSVKMPSWTRCVTRIEPEGSEPARRQENEWLCGRREHPVCVAESTGRVRAYSVATTDETRVAELLAVCQPMSGDYVFSERAWNFFPEYFNPV